MPQPVLSIQGGDKPEGPVSVNLLPCKVHHDGPIGSIQAHWSVDKPEGGTPTAYFRGRKLHGTTVKIPEAFRGVLVQKQDDKPTGQAENTDNGLDDGLDEGPDDAPEGRLQTTGEFQDLMIWGHESVADSSSDNYLRGMEEWIEVSNRIHSFAPEASQEGMHGEKQP
ncbi:uncharacterized protein DNG_05883 [Cephalotrichum gorgonifer]|uniref:Uncharacterized protein n=1 Tax=Cephalotrichum gorgonifer TaxID=2041049 RepID=A0AAE8MYM4_9PEZI|nr:uncharacterized protein DNG_05883 [Cephalotrichum gorgonifer]